MHFLLMHSLSPVKFGGVCSRAKYLLKLLESSKDGIRLDPPGRQRDDKLERGRGQSASASEGIEMQSHSTQLETTPHHPAAGEMSQEEM